MMSYDVVVVGAGPIGSTFAREMVQKGFKVGIVEKKRNIGVPLQCAGLVGKKVKGLNVLPNKFILNKVQGAHLYSPSHHLLSVSKREPVAYVLDRVGYDKFLADLAVESGADLFLNYNVTGLDAEKGIVSVSNGEKKIHADIIVGADGYKSLISKKFNSTSETIPAAQFLVDFGKNLFNTDYVRLYVDSRISPGFMWIIPLSESKARIGLFGNRDYHNLNTILKEFLNKNKDFKGFSITKKYHGMIPVYNPKKKIVKDRTIILGDAASQIKPTTGGGLIIGFKCVSMAVESASKALDNENIKILREYEMEYRKKYRNELNTQLKVQKIFKSLTDDDLDHMFLKLKEEGAEDLISEYGDMDNQSPLIRQMIKTGLIFKIIPKIISRGITTLWK
jgi:digeranylgeranylglycerophospholipid reductase